MVIKLHDVKTPSGKVADDSTRNRMAVLASTFGDRIKLANVRQSPDPEQPRTPNADTARVLQEIERGEGIVRYNNLAELISDCERSAEAPDS